jgi:hypothetical protein
MIWVTLKRGVLLVALMVGGCAAGCGPHTDPWFSRVDSVTDEEVCTVALQDVADWGISQGDRECFSRTDKNINWDDLELVAGDCLQINVHHPVTVIEKEVRCPR